MVDSKTEAKPMHCLVIIPAYNEAENIGEVIDKLHKQGFDVVVIDDHSADNTSKIVEQHGATLLKHCSNMGYGVALQTGYRYAIQQKYECVVQMDGDGQHSPEFVKTLVDTLYEKQVDLVIGNRHMMVGSYKVPKHRRAGQKLFSTLLQMFSGLKIDDPTSGFQALRLNVLKFYVSDLYPDDFPDANILLLCRRMGFKVIETPVVMHESSGVSMHRGFWRPVFYVTLIIFSILVGLFTKLPKREDEN
ncbi:MAG: glycosyltransferase family 2 protein [Magnetococcales bacterium]|nr:glycosyltransferase family 2 protein [Magnetococcales bacterium]